MTNKILFETILIVSHKDIDELMLIADGDKTSKILHQVVVGLRRFPRILSVRGSAKVTEEYFHALL